MSQLRCASIPLVPDVHVPHLDEHDEENTPASVTRTAHRSRGKSLVKIVLEVVLISTGVFLGLAGEQWRENAHHRELANQTLRRFQSEILANRKAVAAVKDYHAAKRTELHAYFDADAKRRQSIALDLEGIQVAFVEHTAWDLALASSALAYIDPDLAFAISHIYITQENLRELTRGVVQSMYINPPSANTTFLGAVSVYYDDVVLVEPLLLTMYDDVLPQIASALGTSTGAASR
jgi:hypothetical protein